MKPPIILTEEEVTRATMPEKKQTERGWTYYVHLGDDRPEVDHSSYARVRERLNTRT